MPYMLGRKPRTHKPVPHMSAITAGKKLEAPPPSIDYTHNMPGDLGMMLNDVEGICTCAGAGHGEQVWTFNATGKMVTTPDSCVQRLYELACGYVPGDASTDQGGNEQDVLTYWLKHGMPTASGGADRIAAFVEVDPRNIDDVKRAIYHCGFVYVGFQVPSYILPNDGSPPPYIWDVNINADNSIVGGHCVILPGYTIDSLFRVVSWGSKGYQMTLPFFMLNVSEVYAIADRSWISAKGMTPGGLSLTQLESLMNTVLRAP